MKLENSSEIKIIPIDLKIDLPSDHLCMIMAQPFLKLQTTNNGFKLDRSILEIHKKTILSTLELSYNLPFGNSLYNTNFVVFPELSLPYDMISTIKDKMLQGSWKDNSILIGGLEGISVEKYLEIVQKSDNPVESNYKLLGMANYVNCAVVFIKENHSNSVKMYVQPKIKPSRREQAIGMQEGRHIFIFNSSKMNFFCLTCFDAISIDLNFKLLTSKIIGNLKEMAEKGKIPNVLDMVFLLMHNKKPDFSGFQKSTYQILNGGGRELRSDHGSVVFVNTANSKHGSSTTFGKSAFYFRREAWYIPPTKEYPPPDTYCMEKTECECQRARFREDGPSLHVFSYIPYVSETHLQGSKWYPLKDVAWFSITSDGTLLSPQSVPAIKKVVVDNLPPNLCDTDNRWHAPNDVNLAYEMKQKYLETIKNLMNVRIERMKELTDLLLLCHYSEDNRIENPDYWETRKEGEAIKELVSTLSILTLIGEMVLDLPHKILTGFLRQRFYVAVIDGKGAETKTVLQKKYGEYVETNKYINIDPEKNILMVLCRHRGEHPPNGIAKEIVDFTLISRSEDSTMPQELQDANKFTVITGGRLFWHSRESLHGILEQNSLDEARTKLEEKLVPLTK